MNEKEKILREINYKGKSELNLPEFYKALNNAINTNNMQSIYGLSKIFTRYCFKSLDI
jgi:hypothetical protein